MSGVRMPASSPTYQPTTTQGPAPAQQAPKPQQTQAPAAPAPAAPTSSPAAPSATAQSAQDAHAAAARDPVAAAQLARTQSASGSTVQQAAGPNGPKAVPVGYGKDGAAAWVAQREVKGPKAEAQRVAEDAQVNINSGSPQEQLEARKALAASTPQINDTSVKAGNSQSICGAAAMTNSLILTDKGGANAKAIESLASKAGVQTSDEEKTAIQNFKDGKLSPKDVQHLQQVVYRTGVKGETGNEPKPNVTPEGLELGMKKAWVKPSPQEASALAQFKKDPSKLTEAQKGTLQNLAFTTGITQNPTADLATSPPHQLTSGGMGGLVAGLKGEGAFPGGEKVTFNNSKLKDPSGHTFNHWTADVNGTHMNSLATSSGGPAGVSSSTPSEVAQKAGDKNFAGRVTLDQSGGKPSMSVATPNPDGRSYTNMGYQADNSSAAAWSGAYKALNRMTRNTPTEDSKATVDNNKAIADD